MIRIEITASEEGGGPVDKVTINDIESVDVLLEKKAPLLRCAMELLIEQRKMREGK